MASRVDKRSSETRPVKENSVLRSGICLFAEKPSGEPCCHSGRLTGTTDVGQPSIESAAIFGASGGIGRALVEALAQRRVATIHAGSRSGNVPQGKGIHPFRFDYDTPSSLKNAAAGMADTPPQLVVVATGVLTLPDGTGPERSYRQLEADTMAQVLQLNTIGPALAAQAMLPLFPKAGRSVFAALSARVGSIGDNSYGGWHSSVHRKQPSICW